MKEGHLASSEGEKIKLLCGLGMPGWKNTHISPHKHVENIAVLIAVKLYLLSTTGSGTMITRVSSWVSGYDT
jgi:hypothetical protein